MKSPPLILGGQDAEEVVDCVSGTHQRPYKGSVFGLVTADRKTLTAENCGTHRGLGPVSWLVALEDLFTVVEA